MTVIGYKRSVDQTMYTNQAIWLPDTFQAYKDYIDTAFLTGQAVNRDAKIRTSIAQLAELPGWQENWRERFTDEDAPNHGQSYERLMRLMSRDFMLDVRGWR